MIRKRTSQGKSGRGAASTVCGYDQAKEKLILTGAVGKLDKRIPSLAGFLEEEGQVLPLGVRLKARNYWDFVLPALARHRSMTELFGEYGVPMHRVEGFYDDPADLT